MNTPRRAKYCPRCRTMTTLEETKCLYCGHEFSTSVSGSLLTEEMLNKTQMFNLPPALPRPNAEPPPIIPAPAAGREDNGNGLMLRIVLSVLLCLIALGLMFLWWRQL